MKNLKGLAAIGLLAFTALAAYAAQDRREIRIESTDDRRVTRKVDHNGRVRLVRRLSDAPCIEGRTWGYDRSSIWVDDGCRAVFEYETGYRDNRDRNTGGILDRIRIDDIFGINRRSSERTQTVRVESDGDRTYRRVDTSGGVRLVRRLSDAPCVQGRSWGYDRNGIWVDDGCRAEFEVRGYSSSRDRNRDDRGQVWLPGRGVPNWAVGDWQGIRNADDIEMRIRSDGSVVLGRNGALSSGRRGEVRGNRMEIDDMDFRIERNGQNGIVLFPVNARTGPLYFSRDRFR